MVMEEQEENVGEEGEGQGHERLADLAEDLRQDAVTKG